jgi:uncharacterized protein YjbI with pentapeptide repeats
MTKKELLERWNSPVGENLLKAVFSALKKNRPLSVVEGIEIIDSRIDLRGAVLSVVKDQRTIGTEEHSLIQTIGSLKLKHAGFENIDFSYADISYAVIQECSFRNCLFNGTKAKEVEIFASDFENCGFEKTDFSYAYMNKNIAANAGSFKNCIFSRALLREAIFSFPITDNCVFQDCNLYATNFDGARMKNITFTGLVDSPIFSGYSTTAERSAFWVFNKINPLNYPNLMENVDFKEADLQYVLFQHELDPSRCRFPESGDFFIVNNIGKIFPKLRDYILINWAGGDVEKAISLIDNLYYGPRNRG